MKRRYRKRRYRRRTRRYYTKRYNRRRGSITEVKYYTNIIQNQALKLAISATDTDSLFGEQCYLSNILQNIGQGTGSGERIGSKIYVMKINVRMLAYGCPSDNTYMPGTFLTRHIWHSSSNSAGAVIPNFFLAPSKVNFHQYPDRRLFTIHRDKTIVVPSTDYTTGTTTHANAGPIKYISYNVPVNRYVTYNLNNKPKEDYNVYSLALLTASPGMSNTVFNTRQIGCFQLTYRIYFKDA